MRIWFCFQIPTLKINNSKLIKFNIEIIEKNKENLQVKYLVIFKLYFKSLNFKKF